ncbi:MAG TPA: phage tail tube protein [Trichocoleus sp.]|jgi:hypothetical protein
MAKTSFVIGRGTKVSIAMLPEGSSIEPKATTITLAAPAAKDINGSATITVPALGADVLIPAGSFLAFVAPTTGKSVLVQLSADAETGDTTLTVPEIPEDIATGSVAVYPLRLAGRTAANIGRSGNRVSAVDFDSDGYSTGLTASIEQTLELPGNWVPQDAGFATAEHLFTELREAYVWLELPKISAAYSKGRIYKGKASITDLPLEISADGVITGNISLTFNGKPDLVLDAAVA